MKSVACVVCRDEHLGIAILDQRTCLIVVLEVCVESGDYMYKLQSLMNRHHVAEVILSKAENACEFSSPEQLSDPSDTSAFAIDKLLASYFVKSFPEIALTFRPHGAFDLFEWKQVNATEKLRKLVYPECAKKLSDVYRLKIGSTALFEMFECIKEPLGSSKYRLATGEMLEGLVLNSNANKTLEIFPDYREARSIYNEMTGFSNKHTSESTLAEDKKLDTRATHSTKGRAKSSKDFHNDLFGVLNHTKTVVGERQLYSWLQNPLTDISQINTRLNLVRSFVVQKEIRNALRDRIENLHHFPYMDRVLQNIRLNSPIFNIADLIPIYKCMLRLNNIKETLEKMEDYDLTLQNNLINAVKHISK